MMKEQCKKILKNIYNKYKNSKYQVHIYALNLKRCALNLNKCALNLNKCALNLNNVH